MRFHASFAVIAIALAEAPTSAEDAQDGMEQHHHVIDTPAFRIPGLDLSGDLRVQGELNSPVKDARDRWRSEFRARIRATYRVSSSLTIGAQIENGEPEDPDSADIALSNVDDYLDPTLDQAWARYTQGDLTAVAGKFPQIFKQTDMVWDADFAPKGVGATYGKHLSNAYLEARATYFVIDNDTASDSDMIGGQVLLMAALSPVLNLTLAGSYYHYRLGSVAQPDSEDIQGNIVALGRYLSDFRLAGGLAALNWNGLTPRWPIAVTLDYVRNLGAAVSTDTAVNFELVAGRTEKRGDWRIAYNYARVGVDAIFAAFAHDNLSLATNYKLHGLSIAHAPAKDMVVDFMVYRYRPLDPLYAGTNNPAAWLNRVRLNFLVNF
ncbi:putative porin [Novosphingobium aquae]|uniref:Porin n=1 Tax=Novosphingobium aquae TaxID=3133435 RepID=A0ABU8SBW4_9SPHN